MRLIEKIKSNALAVRMLTRLKFESFPGLFYRRPPLLFIAANVCNHYMFWFRLIHPNSIVFKTGSHTDKLVARYMRLDRPLAMSHYYASVNISQITIRTGKPIWMRTAKAEMFTCKTIRVRQCARWVRVQKRQLYPYIQMAMNMVNAVPAIPTVPTYSVRMCASEWVSEMRCVHVKGRHSTVQCNHTLNGARGTSRMRSGTNSTWEATAAIPFPRTHTRIDGIQPAQTIEISLRIPI